MLHDRTRDEIITGTLYSHLICEIHLRDIYEVWGRFWSNLQRPISKAVVKMHRNNNACLRVGLLCYVIRSESESYWFVRCCEIATFSLWSSWLSVILGHGAVSTCD